MNVHSEHPKECMRQRLQHILHMKPLFNDVEPDDTSVIDFKNASLYVLGLQVMVTIVLCSLTSIIACSILPVFMISAVRTLVLISIVGAVCVRKPIRVGRVHGLNLVFNSLRPAVVVYICSLVIEQLTHACSVNEESPSWRYVVFHTVVVIQVASGFLRARAPLATTDVPFLITACALLLLAILPPPAISMSGPLCSPPSLYDAADRLVRAVCFSLCYTVFTYVSAPPCAASSEVLVCLMRSTAASVWTLGASLPLLVLVIPQCGMAIYFRLLLVASDVETGSKSSVLAHEPMQNGHGPFDPLSTVTKRYGAVPTKSPCETDAMLDPACLSDNGSQRSTSPPPSTVSHGSSTNGILGGPLTFRDVSGRSHATNTNSISKERMAQIASEISTDDDPQ